MSEPKASVTSLRRIVVADDDPNVRLLLQFNLEAEGFQVASCDNGTTAGANLVATPGVTLDT